MTDYSGLYNEKHYDKFFNQNHFSEKKLNFRIIENGTILPHKHLVVNGQWTWGFGGIVDSNGNFVKSSFVNSNAGAAYTPEEEIQYNPATVIYLAMYFGVWGHCITDEIRRIWFLKTDVFKNYFSSCQIVIVPFGGGGIIQNFIRLLEILEVDLSKIIILNKPIKFQNIILPDESFFSEDTTLFTKEYVETIERVRSYAQKNFTELPQRKFFLKYDYDVQFGAERLANFFSQNDYEVIKPENFPLDEQLNIFANCEKLASTEGSCSHNSIFLKDNTEVLLIPRSATRLTVYQLTLNQLHNQEIFYIDSALSLFATEDHGPFCYLISPQLKKFFGENESWSKEDFEIFLQYVNFSLERNLKPLPVSKEYYSDTLKNFMENLTRHKDLLEKYKNIFERLKGEFLNGEFCSTGN